MLFLLGVSPALPAANFRYDMPDRTVAAAMLKGPQFYDPSVVCNGGQLWLAWLDMVPGKGDRIWVGRRNGDGWAVKEQVSDSTGLLGESPVQRSAWAWVNARGRPVTDCSNRRNSGRLRACWG